MITTTPGRALVAAATTVIAAVVVGVALLAWRWALRAPAGEPSEQRA